MRKTVLISLLLLAVMVVALGNIQPTGVTEWSIERAASKVRIDSAGQIRIEPRSGKQVDVKTADSLTVGGVIVPQTLFVNWTNIGAANASGDSVFIAQRALQVTAIKIDQRAQGGSGCVIDVEKLTGTTAPGSGTVLGTAAYNCNSTVNNTVTTYTLTATTATLQLAAGNRLGLKLGGTLTALAGATITIQLKAI